MYIVTLFYLTFIVFNPILFKYIYFINLIPSVNLLDFTFTRLSKSTCQSIGTIYSTATYIQYIYIQYIYMYIYIYIYNGGLKNSYILETWIQ